MKPILFNSEMVRAILDGRKTCTRRLIKPQPDKGADLTMDKWCTTEFQGWSQDYVLTIYLADKPFVRGDVLWVRETWLRFVSEHVFDGVKFAYKADIDDVTEQYRKELGYKWHPSIHMPKEAARIFLRVTDVRADRLNCAGMFSALSEGATDANDFARIWDSTLKPADLATYGWGANPWVWVIKFERIEKPKGQLI